MQLNLNLRSRVILAVVMSLGYMSVCHTSKNGHKDRVILTRYSACAAATAKTVFLWNFTKDKDRTL